MTSESPSLRLSPRAWLATAGLSLAAMLCLPSLWTRQLPSRPSRGADRIPVAHSEDYWLSTVVLRQARRAREQVWLGDSVVWGAYVRPSDSWTARLAALRGPSRPLHNLALNGLHPIAMRGLLQTAWSGLRDMDVAVHCNPLWLSSPRRDFSGQELDLQNHAWLLPAVWGRLPGDRRPAAVRVDACIQRAAPFFRWARHLRILAFQNQAPAAWMLEHPHAWPAPRMDSVLPRQEPLYAAAVWEDRPGARAWDPPWVELQQSRQWEAFLHVLDLLQQRGNRVQVLVGPLNAHMLSAASRDRYQALLERMRRELDARGQDSIFLEPPESRHYADASHPLAPGYQDLARQVARHDAAAAPDPRPADFPP